MLREAYYPGPAIKVTESVTEGRVVLSYEKIEGRLDTGDVVLFSGNTWAAKSVKWFTGSPWSHVGLVVRHPAWGNQPLVWEATRSSLLKDLCTGAYRGDGVQLVSLQEKLASYPGTVAVRRWAVDTERPSFAEVTQALHMYHARPYRDYVRRNLAAFLDASERHSGAAGTFCSEFVAEVLMRWGLLAAHRPSRYYVPADFSEERSYSQDIRLGPSLFLHP